jgi:septal ring factor EnvC (AmiA/AmiB activator)
VRRFSFTIVLMLSVCSALCPAVAQDIRGMENCSAEKQMERRTGCLQANVEFLQQEMAKLKREMQNQLNAANRDLAAVKTENAATKAALTKLEADLAQLKARATESPAKK